jgi:hypothetical protein
VVIIGLFCLFYLEQQSLWAWWQNRLKGTDTRWVGAS